MKAMSATAQSWLGKKRQCNECGEWKAISIQTFSLLNSDPTGWHKTCRTCQTVRKGESGAHVHEPVEIANSFDDLINEMYYLGQMGKDPDRLAEIIAELRKRLRDVKDKRKNFEMFIDILKPLIAGWREPGAIHEDIKDGLLDDDALRVLIIATRYSAKSTLTGIYVTWEIFNNPLIKIMVISRGSKLANRMLRTVRRVFIENCPLLWHLKPNADTCLDNAEQFQTPQSAAVATGGVTLTSVGVTSNLPGFRADLTIGDDVEGTADDTPEKVQDLMELLNELHMINPAGRKIMLGTYQSEFSIYAQYADQIDEEGNAVWKLYRACMFEEDELGIHSRWPEMFSDKQALDWRRSVTSRAWRLHALLIADPAALRDRPLKIRDLPVIALDPDSPVAPLRYQLHTLERGDLPTWGAPRGDVWSGAVGSPDNAAYVHTLVAVDPSSGLAGHDAIGVSVIGVTPSGYAIIRHLEGVRRPSKAEAVTAVANVCKHFRANILVVEELKDGFFGSTLEGMLSLIGWPLGVEQVTTGGINKGRRIIETLAPVMSTGRLLICEKVVNHDHGADFVNQMVQIAWDRSSKNSKTPDDIVDSLAHGVARIKGMLTSDEADNLADIYAQRMEQYRDIPMREGGLKEGEEDRRYGRSDRPHISETSSFIDAITQDSEAEIKIQARLDSWRGTMEDLVLRGVVPEEQARGDARLLWELQRKVARNEARLKELKEAVVF